MTEADAGLRTTHLPCQSPGPKAFIVGRATYHTICAFSTRDVDAATATAWIVCAGVHVDFVGRI